MADNDVVFNDQNIVPFSFKPRERDRGSNVRESVVGISDNAGNQIDPAKEGTIATGVVPLTGGVGSLGFLSSIYSKLIGPIAVTGTFFQTTQPVSAGSLPLPAGASTSAVQASQLTQETASATAAGAPADAAWASGSGSIIAILKKIASGAFTLADGANVALGSIADAAWSGSGNGTLNAIQKAIYGRLAAIGSSMLLQTPTVTSNGVYASGRVIGGKMTFTRAANGGTLMSATVTSKSILTTTLKLLIFTTNPTNSTWTNNVAPAINAADVPFLLTSIPLNAPDSSAGGLTVWSTGGLGLQFSASNLYGILINTSAATLTSASTSDISVQLGISEDK